MDKYEDVEYIDLANLISFEGFWRHPEYWTAERTILEPRLVELGYSEIVWGMGEFDSFGPLTRVVSMRNKAGEVIHGIYG